MVCGFDHSKVVKVSTLTRDIDDGGIFLFDMVDNTNIGKLKLKMHIIQFNKDKLNWSLTY